MEFIETILFQKKAKNVLDGDQLRQLQITLMLYPGMGAVIPGSGGLRKLRWVSAGKGKRGGLRVIYYWVTDDHKIFLLYVYSKAKQEDLTRQELKLFKTLIEEE